MNKLAIPLLILLVFIVLALAAYASGDVEEQPNALAAQATVTESMVEHTTGEIAPQTGERELQDTVHPVDAHTEGNTAHAEHQEDHALPETVHEDDGHAVADHPIGEHGVPAAAAAVTNPILASDDSISSGAAIFSQSCVACHGATGEGDGPGATAFDPKPADLHANHVQGNSDGAIFWIISHGREGTAMPPWDIILTEEQRWDLVNFLRTFREE